MTMPSYRLAVDEPTQPEAASPEATISMDTESPWETAAAQAADTAAAGEPGTVASPIFVAAHGGAGVTTWSRILGGVDVGELVPTTPTGPVYLVARASIAGVVAAKAAVADYGEKFSGALIVPASPGRPHKSIANELRILSGAIDLVRVPWVPLLLTKRPGDVVPGDLGVKDLARVRAELNISNEGDPQ